VKIIVKCLVALLTLAGAFTCCPLQAQIPSGYVQTTATVSGLANGTFGASWTNLSSSVQLGLLGCVSTFQTTVNGRLDSNGHFSILLADTAQICPSPSTWTFAFTVACPAGATNNGFLVAVPVTGGGGTEDISAQITAAFPTDPCKGGGGGGSGTPGGSNTDVQVNSYGAFAGYATLTYDPAVGLCIDGCPEGFTVTVGPQEALTASWILDDSTPQTTADSILGRKSGCLEVAGGVVSGSGAPCGTGTGTVTNVAVVVAAGSPLTVSGSPVTSSGTFTIGAASSGVTAGTYAYPSSITVDIYGRITAIVAGTATSRTCNTNGCYWTDANGLIWEQFYAAPDIQVTHTYTLPYALPNTIQNVVCLPSRCASGASCTTSNSYASGLATYAWTLSTISLAIDNSGWGAFCTVTGN